MAGRFFLALVIFFLYLTTTAHAAKDNEDYDVEVSIKLEVDGKPYQLHRLIAYRVPRVKMLCPGCGLARPSYHKFGIKLDTGEGIIVWDSPFCGSCALDATLDDYKMKEGERRATLPVIGLVDNVAAPRKIVVYRSYAAYTAANSRVQLISISKRVVKTSNPDRTDKADEFRNFVDRNWKQLSFIQVPKDVWDISQTHLISPELRTTLNAATTPLMLGKGGLDDFLAGKLDVSVYLDAREYSTNLDENTRRFFSYNNEFFSTSPSVPNLDVYSMIVPYVFKDGVWGPDYPNRGRIILINSKMEDLDQFSDAPFDIQYKSMKPTLRLRKRKLRLDNGNIFDFNYFESADPWDALLPNALYLPSEKAVFIPLHNP